MHNRRFGGSLDYNSKIPKKCVSLDNRPCQTRPTLANVNSNQPLFYAFTVSAQKCGGSCNTIDDPYSRLCVPNKIKNVNVKVFNLMMNVIVGVIGVLVKIIICGIPIHVTASVIRHVKLTNIETLKNVCVKKSLFGKLLLACEGEIWNTTETSFDDKKVTCEKRNYLIYKILLVFMC